MSHKLEKPYTDNEFADFVTEYNHRQGLLIQETEKAVYALEKNEILDNTGVPIINPHTEEELKQARKEKFEKEFFETSLGWIRRKVNMKDGSTKDFLSDLLLPIKAGIELNQDVKIITYKKPDFSEEISDNYEALQEKKSATIEFVIECLNRTVLDFGA